MKSIVALVCTLCALTAFGLDKQKGISQDASESIAKPGTPSSFNPFNPPFPQRTVSDQGARSPARVAPPIEEFSRGEFDGGISDPGEFDAGPNRRKEKRRNRRARQNQDSKSAPGFDPILPPSEGLDPSEFPFPPPMRPKRAERPNRGIKPNPNRDPNDIPDPPFGPDEDDQEKDKDKEVEVPPTPPNGPDNGPNFDFDDIPDPPFGDDQRPILDRRATFELTSGITPEYDGYKSDQVQLAALNLLLNSLSSHPKLVTINPASIRDGKVAIESFGSGRNRVALGEIFNLGAIDDLLREEKIKNPYQCNGDDRFQFRLDWLMSTLMNDEVYSKMLDLPDNWGDLADRLGVDETPPGRATTNPDKVWVENSMISSSEHGRLLEFQDQRGKINRIVLRSTDFPRSPKPGREAEFSDPSLHPNDYEGAAGEFIFNLPNGLFAYKLAGKNGATQPEAPASIVVNDSDIVGGDFPSNHRGSEISSPRDCMRCHRSGPIGQDYMGDWNIKDELAKRVKQRLITEQEAKDAEERYTTGEKYVKRMTQVRKNYLKKLKDANAFIGDEYGDMVPLMPDFEAVYRKDVDFKQVAKELGMTEGNLEASLKEDGNESLRDRLGISMKDGELDRKDFKIKRHIFEKVFCELKEGLVGEQPLLNEPVEDEDAPLTNDPVHSPGTTTR